MFTLNFYFVFGIITFRSYSKSLSYYCPLDVRLNGSDTLLNSF